MFSAAMKYAATTALASLPFAVQAEKNALIKYVRQPDTAFAWNVTKTKTNRDSVVHRITLTSQGWRGTNWTHDMVVVRPAKVRNPDIAFLYVTGSADPAAQLEVLQRLAKQAGAVTALIGDVPNQPLYGGRSEDALIAYTFDQFARTGDETWPVLFPMVKSVIRGIDAVQQLVKEQSGAEIERVVVSGASKRGWTTWLTAAVDQRVAGIAPMVFDMLNMKAQTAWAQKVYGHQSEAISDYSDANLIARINDPAIAKLREWVDPYSYRSLFKMPKLILLGTNDPYWTVDSLRHYWSDLPEPKLVYQTPNAGHGIAGGKEAINTLAAFFEMIADRTELPQMQWSIRPEQDAALIKVHVNQSAKSARLWTSSSPDRDFRNDQWKSREVSVKSGSAHVEASIDQPAKGYRAFLIETDLTSPSGQNYKLSTEARVTPDFN
jgi:PhoPQ-activated pathogenicity-related protein